MAWHEDFGREMNRMQRKFERFLGGFGNEEYSDYRRAFADFEENENEFIAQIELPGIEKENIKIDVKNNQLIVKAVKKKQARKEDVDGRYYSKSVAGFYQSISIPEDADSEKIDAVYKNGVLTISMPRIGSKNKRTINIK